MLPDPNTAQSAGWALVALAALAASINQILRLTDRLKSKPPGEQLASESSELARRLDALEEHSVSRSMCDTQHRDFEHRLATTENQISELWNTMRTEDASIRKDIADKFEGIQRSLGRIEGNLAKAISDRN